MTNKPLHNIAKSSNSHAQKDVAVVHVNIADQMPKQCYRTKSNRYNNENL